MRRGEVVRRTLAHTLAGKTPQTIPGDAPQVVVPRAVPVHRSERAPGHAPGQAVNWLSRGTDAGRNDTVTSSSRDDILTRTITHLESAYRLACRAAGSELLSLWANIAMSIHLASAGLSVHVPGFPPAVDHPDCLSALRAAQAELARLPADHDLPIVDLAAVLSRLASALRETQSVQPRRCRLRAPPRRCQRRRH